jgi:hypothetical protein
MVSLLKSETARANGAKSRGPSTASGKEKSSRNAIRHGLTAGNGNILLDCEDPNQFDEALNKLLAILKPETPAEEDIVEEMVAARWRIRRMWTIETGLLNAEILKRQPKSDVPKLTVQLASAFRSLTDSPSLTVASRYEARLQRIYDRAYKTLRELQQARKSEPPQEPHTINIRWVKTDEEPDHPVESASPVPEPEPVAQAFVPVFRNAAPPADETPLRNEPTVDANKELVPQTPMLENEKGQAKSKIRRWPHSPIPK